MQFDDNNTYNNRPSGFASQDMPDYADHANEIINCTGTGDGNLTVRVYTPQGSQIRTITLNNPPGTQSWAQYPVFYSGSESRLIGRFDKQTKESTGGLIQGEIIHIMFKLMIQGYVILVMGHGVMVFQIIDFGYLLILTPMVFQCSVLG